MKHLVLAFCLLTIGLLQAINNNVELIANKDFSDPTLFANQAALAATDPAGKWFAGNIAQFTTSIATGAFESTTVTGGTFFYDYFLGQITSEILVTGRYHLSLRAKGGTPFFLKISGTNAVGTEWPSLIKNTVGIVETSGLYAGYSIKFTPTADWSTIEADLDITVATDSPARLYFIFPDAGSVSLDDVSFMRTKDIPVFTTYYIRPTGDATSWKNMIGIDPDQIYTSSTPTIVGTNTYYFAKGNYSKTTVGQTTPAIAMTTGKMYGGFSGGETTIDLAARALSDKDGNGIIEPWELTNETTITGNNPISGARTAARLITVTGGEINGFTIQDHYFNASGAITLGQVSSTPSIANDIDANAGKMINCTVKKLKVDAASSAPVMTTNKSSVIDGCLIEECIATAGSSAGAVFMNLNGGKILNSVLRNNIASFTGTYAGAIRATAQASTDMNAIVQNCAIYNNTSFGGGGAMRSDGIASKRGLQIINCTVVNNKTATANTGSVDFINGGIIVNSIVVDDPKDEIRPNTANHYISNNAYGALFLGTVTAYPTQDATVAATGKTAADFNFMSYSSYVGAMQLGATDFVQTTYDAIRASNFKITAAASAAVQNVGLKILPTSYLIGGTGSSVTISATAPTTDITGKERNASYVLNLGAYQFSDGTTALSDNINTTSQIYASGNKIIILNSHDLPVSVYAITGQLAKSINATSDKSSIVVEKGIYIVKCGNQISKVIVK